MVATPVDRRLYRRCPRCREEEEELKLKQAEVFFFLKQEFFIVSLFLFIYLVEEAVVEMNEGLESGRKGGKKVSTDGINFEGMKKREGEKRGEEEDKKRHFSVCFSVYIVCMCVCMLVQIITMGKVEWS
jgi:hypothetical protein